MAFHFADSTIAGQTRVLPTATLGTTAAELVAVNNAGGTKRSQRLAMMCMTSIIGANARVFVDDGSMCLMSNDGSAGGIVVRQFAFLEWTEQGFILSTPFKGAKDATGRLNKTDVLPTPRQCCWSCCPFRSFQFSWRSLQTFVILGARAVCGQE